MLYLNFRIKSTCFNEIDWRVKKMDKHIQDKLKVFYDRLTTVKNSGVILHAWSDESDTEDGEILTEIYEFLSEDEVYNELNADWAEAYIQLFALEFEVFHEGAIAYYANVYEFNDYNTLLKTAEYFKTNGYDEIYNIYAPAIYDYSGLKWSEFPKEWTDKAGIVGKWIDNNIDKVYYCMLDILMKNIKKVI